MLSLQKVVMVAVEYGRLTLLTRGSNYRLLTGKNWVFWIGSPLREVDAHGGSTVGTKRFNLLEC